VGGGVEGRTRGVGGVSLLRRFLGLRAIAWISDLLGLGVLAIVCRSVHRLTTQAFTSSHLSLLTCCPLLHVWNSIRGLGRCDLPHPPPQWLFRPTLLRSDPPQIPNAMPPQPVTAPPPTRCFFCLFFLLWGGGGGHCA